MKIRCNRSFLAVCHLFSGAVCIGAVLLISIRAQAQNLFVTGQNFVEEITPGGGQSIVADLVYPSGLAFDGAGDLFVSSGDARPGLGEIKLERNGRQFFLGSVVLACDSGF